MKTNEQLQKDVQDALKWEPLLNAAEVGVIVKDGIVTLTGTVDNYLKKTEAEDAAKKVAGVKAVVEEIEVSFGNEGNVTDSEIARQVLNALNWNWQIPNDQIKVTVEGGWVTLEGELNWNYQREAAKGAVRGLIGVKGVLNNTKISPASKDVIEAEQIERALARDWSINANDIAVTVSGSTVTLTGTVSSSHQKEEAERIAWKAPGVWTVDNNLIIEYDYLMAG
ncbi:MAG TPA: BON domain-containing protein [Chryseolinea sp.]